MYNNLPVGICLSAINDKKTKSSMVDSSPPKETGIADIRPIQETKSVCESKSSNIIIHVVDPNTGQK